MKKQRQTTWYYQHTGQTKQKIFFSGGKYHYLDHPSMGGGRLTQNKLVDAVYDLRSHEGTKVWSETIILTQKELL